MTDLWVYISAGTIFGLTAGLSPGPLQTVMITETLRHGFGSGVRVAIAPLLTDAPIVAAALFIVARLSEMEPVLGVISLMGGVYLGFLAFESMRYKTMKSEEEASPNQSLRKGIIANLLNPAPYVFWFSVGAPTVIRAHGVSLFAAIAYVLCLYAFLVGSKIGIAWAVAKSRPILKSRVYQTVMKILGFILFGFAFYYILIALQYFGIVENLF